MITFVVANAQLHAIRDLATYFDRVSDISLISYANDGAKAIEIVNKYQPNVIIIDLEIPVINGIEATNIITQRFPNTKIILQVEENYPILNLALNAGAKGVIFKTTKFTDLETNIRLVSQGFYQIGTILSEYSQAKSTAILAMLLDNENNNFTEIQNGINGLKQSMALNQEMMTTLIQQPKSKSKKYGYQHQTTSRKYKPRRKYEYRRKYLIDLSYLGNDSFFITGFILGVLCCAIAFYFLLSFAP